MRLQKLAYFHHERMVKGFGRIFISNVISVDSARCFVQKLGENCGGCKVAVCLSDNCFTTVWSGWLCQQIFIEIKINSLGLIAQYFYYTYYNKFWYYEHHNIQQIYITKEKLLLIVRSPEILVLYVQVKSNQCKYTKLQQIFNSSIFCSSWRRTHRGSCCHPRDQTRRKIK